MLVKTLKTLTCSLAFAALSHAAQFTYVLDQGYTSSNAVPTGFPVVTVEDDNIANNVLISISLANLSSAEFLTSLVMNFNAAKDAGALNIAPDPINQLPPTSITNGNNIAPPSELSPISAVDIIFNWANSNANGGVNRFNGPEVLVYRVTAGFNFDATDFNVQNADGFVAATHIQGIDNGAGSIKVYDGIPDEPQGEDPTPEPASMMLVGAGGVGIYFLRRRKQS